MQNSWQPGMSKTWNGNSHKKKEDLFISGPSSSMKWWQVIKITAGTSILHQSASPSSAGTNCFTSYTSLHIQTTVLCPRPHHSSPTQGKHQQSIDPSLVISAILWATFFLLWQADRHSIFPSSTRSSTKLHFILTMNFAITIILVAREFELVQESPCLFIHPRLMIYKSNWLGWTNPDFTAHPKMGMIAICQSLMLVKARLVKLGLELPDFYREDI